MNRLKKFFQAKVREVIGNTPLTHTHPENYGVLPHNSKSLLRVVMNKHNDDDVELLKQALRSSGFCVSTGRGNFLTIGMKKHRNAVDISKRFVPSFEDILELAEKFPDAFDVVFNEDNTYATLITNLNNVYSKHLFNRAIRIMKESKMSFSYSDQCNYISVEIPAAEIATNNTVANKEAIPA